MNEKNYLFYEFSCYNPSLQYHYTKIINNIDGLPKLYINMLQTSNILGRYIESKNVCITIIKKAKLNERENL